MTELEEHETSDSDEAVRVVREARKVHHLLGLVNRKATIHQPAAVLVQRGGIILAMRPFRQHPTITSMISFKVTMPSNPAGGPRL